MAIEKNLINQRFIESVEKLLASKSELNKTIVAESLGISKSKFSEILNGRMNVQIEIVADFCTIYKVDANWMLSGKKNNTLSGKISTDKDVDINNLDIGTNYIEIPLYDINATAGLRLLFDNGRQNMIDTIKIPYIKKSDGAISVTGDSMYPLIKSGDIVIYKQIHNLDYLHYGDMYIVSYQINGDDYVVIKYVQKSEKPDHVKLVSYNQHYDPIDIPLSSINAIAIVQANIRYNTM